MILDSACNLFQTLSHAVFISVITRRNDNFIILEYAVILQKFSHSLNAVDTLKEPKGMLKFVAQFRR